MLGRLSVQGNAFYSPDYGDVKYIKNGLFCINEKGFIENVYEEGDEAYRPVRQEYLSQGKLKRLAESEIMLPGFVDLHIHAPQWPQAGTALDRPLETWLGEYTFPLEAKFRDLEFANKVYQDVIKTTLGHGTTTALYFGTVDRAPTTLLAKLCGESGQRGLVGKVAMDDPAGTPGYCRDASAAEAVNETETFIQEVLEFQDSYKQKVYPVITPRFIPSCTDECLKGLGKLVHKYGVHVQTHCSESDWAHQFVRDRHGMNDAQSLNYFGFLTNQTVLAHATFLDCQDVKLLAEKKTSIAHCPLSNAYFANSVLPFHAFHQEGVNIGVATDISGGYSPSMYHAVRQAVISSRMLNEGVDPSLSSEYRGRGDSNITLNHAFYSATAGGGIALNLPIGKLEKGYSFDVQVIDLGNNIPLFYPEKKEEDLFHKILLLSEPQNLKEVWVQGEKVI